MRIKVKNITSSPKLEHPVDLDALRQGNSQIELESGNRMVVFKLLD